MLVKAVAQEVAATHSETLVVLEPQTKVTLAAMAGLVREAVGVVLALSVRSVRLLETLSGAMEVLALHLQLLDQASPGQAAEAVVGHRVAGRLRREAAREAQQAHQERQTQAAGAVVKVAAQRLDQEDRVWLLLLMLPLLLIWFQSVLV